MKFVVPFCVIFILVHDFSVQAGIFTDVVEGPVKNARAAIDNLIIQNIENLQSTVDTVLDNTIQYVSDAQEWAVTTRSEVHGNLKGVLDRIDGEINNLETLSKEKGVNLTGCEEIVHKVHRNVIELMNKTTSCVTDRITKITKNIDPIKVRVNETKAILSVFMEKASECVKDPKTSAVKNVACLTDKNIKVAYEIGKRIPSILIELTSFTGGALFSPIPTGYCISKNAFLTSSEHATTMLNSINQCISNQMKMMNERIESAPKPTPKE